MTRHSKKLKRDEDYLVVEEHPAYTRHDSGKVYRSNHAVKVWLAADGAEVMLCRACERFTSDTVAGVHAHQSVHKDKPSDGEASAIQRIVVAFSLLPDRIQKSLLEKAEKQLREMR